MRLSFVAPYNHRRFGLVAVAITCLLSGCATLGLHPGKASSQRLGNSIYQYLLNGEAEGSLMTQSSARLNLPLKVGIAFLPSSHPASAITAAAEIDLLEPVVERFEKMPEVRRIQIIPSAALPPAGGLLALQQVSRMHGLDIIALVSYDQVQQVGDTAAAFAYWTIIGAYLVPGNEVSTHSFLSVSVFEPHSERLLMNAFGHSQVADQYGTRFIKIDAEKRTQQTQGLQLAMLELQTSLSKEIEQFRLLVSAGDADVSINQRKGYSGGGSLDAVLLMFLFLLMLWRGAAAKRP